MGMHEFVRLCELIEYRADDRRQHRFRRRLLRCRRGRVRQRFDPDTPMGKWRAQNGHPKPYEVKWWCVGNEMWGNWQLGYMSLNHYVLKHNWVEEKMRQVDPTHQDGRHRRLGQCGERSWSEGHADQLRGPHEPDQRAFLLPDPDRSARRTSSRFPNQVKRIADAHREFRRQLPALKGKDIRIALDEWNYWYGPHVFGELGTRYFLKDALGIAAGLHEYFRNTRHHLHGQLRPDRQRDRLHQDHQDALPTLTPRPAPDAVSQAVRHAPGGRSSIKPPPGRLGGPDRRQQGADGGRGESRPVTASSSS